jgi:hypothetical protein
MTGTVYPEVTIQCLSENIQLLTNQCRDTNYMHKDTLWYPNDMKIEYFDTYTCNQISSLDIITSIENYDQICWLQEGELLNKNDISFKSSSFEFRGSISRGYQGTEYSGDTTIIYTFRIISCKTYSFEENTYIGVKLINSNRLGWIAIKGNLYNTRILESAIQR